MPYIIMNKADSFCDNLKIEKYLRKLQHFTTWR